MLHHIQNIYTKLMLGNDTISVISQSAGSLLSSTISIVVGCLFHSITAHRTLTHDGKDFLSHIIFCLIYGSLPPLIIFPYQLYKYKFQGSSDWYVVMWLRTIWCHYYLSSFLQYIPGLRNCSHYVSPAKSDTQSQK